MISYTKRYDDYDIVDSKRASLLEVSAEFALGLSFKVRHAEDIESVADFVYALIENLLQVLNCPMICVLDSTTFIEEDSLEDALTQALIKTDDRRCVVGYDRGKRRIVKRLPEAIILTDNPTTIKNLLDEFWTHARFDVYFMDRKTGDALIEKLCNHVNAPNVNTSESFLIKHSLLAVRGYDGDSVAVTSRSIDIATMENLLQKLLEA